MTPSRKARKFTKSTLICVRSAGHYDEPQCQQVCPVDCILIDEEHPETHEELMAKYEKNHSVQINSFFKAIK